MLQYLRVENLALLEAAGLELESGFTAVTGETGAGKSVLLGALSLLSGNRADKSLIREGAERCAVEAGLYLSEEAVRRVDKVLEAAGLPVCEERQLVLKRWMDRERPSRVFINGGLATLGQLAELSTVWIDFHGPGEPQKLFHESEQLNLLDLFAGQRQALAEYRRGYRELRAAYGELDELQTSQRLSPEEAAYLREQIDAMDGLQLSAERVHELEQGYQRLQNAQEWGELVEALSEQFAGDAAVTDQLRSAAAHARRLADIDPAVLPLADRLESLLIEADDLGAEFAALGQESGAAEEEARQLEEAMEQWLALNRKFGPGVERVLQRREEMQAKLALQGDLKELLAAQQQKIAQLEKGLRAQAADLRDARRKAAAKLGREAEQLLRELGFKHPRLQIEVHTLTELGPSGDSACRISFAPNPGKAPLPLNKIASSGEMARVMLALKSVMAATDATPVLVFDEVDSNIGGEVATAVARLLAGLGRGHQVFCITHLPQVASVADHHLIVTKEQSASATTVNIRSIDGDDAARLDEFARMLGDRSSASARSHAASLLKR